MPTGSGGWALICDIGGEVVLMTVDSQMDVFHDTVKIVEEHVPGFEIRYKDESSSSRVIGALVWIFNREYMTRYTTTRYPRVYFPSREFVNGNPLRASKILLHEFVHMWDRRNKGLWFSVSYALPQLLGLLFLLVSVPAWVFAPYYVGLSILLLGVVLLTPLPAYWRMKAEMRGYAMNMAFNFWRYGSITQNTRNWVADIFVGSGYYFMWPFRRDVVGRVRRLVDMLKSNKQVSNWMEVYASNNLPYQLAYAMLCKHGVVKWQKPGDTTPST
jgi:hypothetical protein